MPPLTPSAGYTLTLRVNLKNVPGTLGRLTTAIGRAGGDLGAVDLVEHRGKIVVRDLTVKCRDEAHSQQIVAGSQRKQCHRDSRYAQARINCGRRPARCLLMSCQVQASRPGG